MIRRAIQARLEASRKSVLLLGPRQVGKSTLARALRPHRLINLMDDSLALGYTKDPARFRREILAIERPSTVLLDEVQKVPALLSMVQVLLDEGSPHRFLLTGSSARKLRRGQANLLPGRIVMEYLDPLSFWELGERLDVEKALRMGTLPGIYLDEQEGSEVLATYGQVYLREEIQAEALTQNLGAYARFLDVAAEASGDWINYSKLSSDTEIPKETIRRFFTLLEDTLIVFRIPPFRPARSRRRVSQRDRFIFFDLGVRNALLGLHRGPLGPSEYGKLFEQWMLLQMLSYLRAHRKPWQVSAYRTDAGAEVDGVLQTRSSLLGIECKWSPRVAESDLRGLRSFETAVAPRPVEKYLVYTGATRQRFARRELAVPYREFLRDVVPHLT